MIKLVLSDLDGTLLPPGDLTVDRNTIDAIDELEASGIKFAVASGRDRNDALSIFGGHAECVENVVGSNGQQLYIDGELVEERFIDRSSVEKIIEVLDRWDSAALIVVEDGRRYIYSCTPEVKERVSFIFRDDLVMGAPLSWDRFIKIGLPLKDTDENRHRLIAELEAAVPEVSFVMCMPQWYDIMPAGTSKATAITRMLDELGVRPEEVVVFGDSANDVQMFDLVPNAVAVSNAAPVAKQHARFHIGSVDEGAVPAALRELARRARENDWSWQA
jgi:hypothetical protein